MSKRRVISPEPDGLARAHKKSWARENSVFIFTFSYLVLRLLFSALLGNNEPDVLAVAKQFAQHSWIPADWYLNLDSSYRLTFNLLLRPVFRILPVLWVSVLGRLGYFVLFALALQKYARWLGIPAVLIIPALFLTTRVEYVVAQEWMLKSLEAKPFAYGFLLLSVVLLHERRHILAAALAGLSVSFHVLVGGYGTIALLVLLALEAPRLKPSGRALGWAIAAYLICASLGFYVVLRNVTASSTTDTVRAGLIYVQSRVPHHVLPGNWVMQYHNQLWRPVLKALLSVTVCVLAVLRPARQFQKTLGLFALSTILFALVGFGVYFAGATYLLKYYFFRLPDVVLPFSAFLLIFSFVANCDPAGYAKYLSGLIRYGGAAATVALVVWAVVPFAADVSILARDPSYFVYREGSGGPRRQLFEWIRSNTARDASFVIPPSEERFYLGAERAQFVSYKNCPQSEADVLEWYDRLRLLNGGEFSRQHEIDWQALTENYMHLSASILRQIRSRYGMDYYVGMSEQDLPFPLVYRNRRYAIYAIEGSD